MEVAHPPAAPPAAPSRQPGWTHTVFPIDDASRIGEARRFAAAACEGMGWTEVEAGRLALVVTELGTNLLKHAQKGRLLVAARPGTADVEVLSIDEGPGIADVGQALRDGFSTGTSPGTGLGAVRRLATDFDLYSTVPGGTVCVARVRRHGAAAAPQPVPGTVQVGAVCVCAPGEFVCGDGWAAATEGPRAAVLLADGLGHGPEAARASAAAVAVFLEQPFGDMRGLLEQAHVALQTTRGAAACLLRLEPDAGAEPGAAATLRCTGAGNVAVRMVSGVADKSMATQHGTVGLQMRKPQETAAALPPHALAIVHSDGIETRWDARRIVPLLSRDPTLVAAVLLRDHTRHRDDATIVVLRRAD